jgi:hypothetical protein
MLSSASRVAAEIEDEARERATQIEDHGKARGDELVAQAEQERQRIWSQVQTLVADATRQVTELLRIREELGSDLREALYAASQALRRLEERMGSTTLGAPEGDPALESASPAVGGEAAAAPPATGGEEAALPAVETTWAPAVTRAQPATKSSAVIVEAGPFESFTAVMSFERSLRELPGVENVYVRRFSGGKVEAHVEGLPPDSLTSAIRSDVPAVTAARQAGTGVVVDLHNSAPDQGQ